MDTVDCYAFAEDEPSCEVIRVLVKHRNEHIAGKPRLMLPTGFPENKHGNGNLKNLLPKLVQMSQNGLGVLVVTDLDQNHCASLLIQEWTSPNAAVSLPKRLWFRLAVREIESWLLADRIGLAKFLGISPSNFPSCPDDLPDPKQFLLNVIRAKCKKRRFRDMLPGRTTSIGPEYNPVLCEFIRGHWRPSRALENSPSLVRAVKSLEQFA